MRIVYCVLGLTLALGATCGDASARIRSDRDRLRAEAEHACYQDAKRFCDADIPDEARVEACMRRHVADLSPGCKAMFERGM